MSTEFKKLDLGQVAEQTPESITSKPEKYGKLMSPSQALRAILHSRVLAATMGAGLLMAGCGDLNGGPIRGDNSTGTTEGTGGATGTGGKGGAANSSGTGEAGGALGTGGSGGTGGIEGTGGSGGTIELPEKYHIIAPMNENNCDANMDKSEPRPTLCLNMRAVNNGEGLESQVCKSPASSLFVNEHLVNVTEVSLGDKPLSSYLGPANVNCDPWQTVEGLEKLICDNTLTFSAQVLSPANCNSNGCTYRTGKVEVACSTGSRE